ncbi:hypothetical protein N5B56_01795 [Eubacterium sp. LFL-14]|uniref:Uncharacterized protein n=1 Tax=Eubacterium album TaxID=2978477 RepID=A0ABT2LXB7_9FIRM|nr:hypothetical protein [Eubacterium sp. LFL-14]MCT7397820.1 hypothetical protein [Eubacterium sp. LFL-14]
MKKFYFTFGDWDKFPFQNGYLIVESKDIAEGIAEFRKHHPDINEGTVNCSFIYNEEEWEKEGLALKYPGKPLKIYRSVEAENLFLKQLLRKSVDGLCMVSKGMYFDYTDSYVSKILGINISELNEIIGEE